MRRGLLRVILLYLLAGLLALLLKQYYSSAGSVQLRWILAPTAYMVSALTGIEFVFNPSSGYAAIYPDIVIAPGCAGLNFLLICFCMLAGMMLRNAKSFISGVGMMVISVSAALCLTFAVNVCRIILSIHSFASSAEGLLLSPGQLHRLEGICIYFLALTFTHSIAGAVIKGYSTGGAGRFAGTSFFVPLFWYLMVMLCVPVFRGSFKGNIQGFIEHVLFVTTVPCLITFGGLFLSRAVCRRASAVSVSVLKDES